MNAITYVEETVPIEKIKEDSEFKELIPSNNSREDLKKSLKENSQIFPLIVDKNFVLIDGYTRLSIMKELKYEKVKVLRYDFDSQQERDRAYELIWLLNGVRRQLDKNEKLALFKKIADKIAEVKASKKITEKSKILSHATEFSSKVENYEKGAEKRATSENNIEVSAIEYEDILKELDKKNEVLSGSEKRKMSILRVYAPWLLEYVTDKKYKVPLNQAFEVYNRAKELNILDKLEKLPLSERDQLIATKDGRKIILNDEYRDLLEKVLSGQYTVGVAIAEAKQREVEKRGGNKAKEKVEEKGEEASNKTKAEVQITNVQEQPPTTSPIAETNVVSEKPPEEVKQEVKQVEMQSGNDIIAELETKGFAEIPLDIAIVKIKGKCYAINVKALRDLEQGFSYDWPKLVSFLKKNNVIVPGEAEGIYIVPWKLIGRCVEWK